jgi:hypothetical protein
MNTAARRQEQYAESEHVRFLEKQIEELRRVHEAEKEILLGKIRRGGQQVIVCSPSSAGDWTTSGLPEAAVRTYAKLWRKSWKRKAIRVFFRLLGGKIKR